MSDHNVVGINFSTVDIKVGGHNVRKRTWKHFDKMSNIDWSQLYVQNYINIANSILEENILKSN